jgi:hypothetical protein
MNIRTGAFRIWIVVAVLWVGLVGWSRWDEIRSADCITPPPSPKTSLTVNEVFGTPKVGDVEGGCRYISAIECIDEKTGRHLAADVDLSDPLFARGPSYCATLGLRIASHAASLPGGLLAIWFVCAWIGRGFRTPPSDRPQGASREHRP